MHPLTETNHPYLAHLLNRMWNSWQSTYEGKLILIGCTSFGHNKLELRGRLWRNLHFLDRITNVTHVRKELALKANFACKYTFLRELLLTHRVYYIKTRTADLFDAIFIF